jgi:solute carrier family 40 (iron-regulated transporter), member 1
MENNLDQVQAYTLYLCHFLSTWNARSYEFAAASFQNVCFPPLLIHCQVVFTATAFPDGLRASSFMQV